MTTETPRMHKFEVAGLGKAPFRFLSMAAQPATVRITDSEGFVWETKGGGSCDFCGTGIMVFCWIRSADGKKFKVGTSCVEKTGDAGMMRVVTRAKREHSRTVRHAREATKIAAVVARLADPTVREALANLPHPQAWRADMGETALDSAEWMMAHAGNSGKIKLGKWLNKVLA